MTVLTLGLLFSVVSMRDFLQAVMIEMMIHARRMIDFFLMMGFSSVLFQLNEKNCLLITNNLYLQS